MSEQNYELAIIDEAVGIPREDAEAVKPAPTYALDTPLYEVSINISTDPKKEKLLHARIKPATEGQEIARENDSVTGYREVNASEEEIVVKDDKANSNLFVATCMEVKGFILPGEDREAAKKWRDLTPEIAAHIPATFKSAFLAATRNVEVKYAEDEDEGFILGGNQLLPVDATFPTGADEDGNDTSITVRFELPEASEDRREEYAETSNELRQSRGEKKKFTRILSNVREGVKLFDELMLMEGASISDNATVNGIPFSQCKNKLSKVAFLQKIEAHLKVRILNTAFRKYNARLSD